MPYKVEPLERVLTYFPEGSICLVEKIFSEYNFKFKITLPRQTKLGTFRAATQKSLPVISINGDLKKEGFLFIFIHELAHMDVWLKFGNKVAPHGKEWKNSFANLMDPFLNTQVFSEDIIIEIKTYFRNNTAANLIGAPQLAVLLGIREDNDELKVSDISVNQTFTIKGGKTFVLLEKRRTRYKCYCPSDKKHYLVHGNAVVISG